jgi:hypothetical protein
MLDKANELDLLGYHKEADRIDRLILATNNFAPNKKIVSPEQKINTKLDVINSKLMNMQDKMDEAEYDSSDNTTEKTTIFNTNLVDTNNDE